MRGERTPPDAIDADPRDRTPSTPTRATAGAPSAERLLEAVSTRHLPDATTAAGGSVPTKKLAGAAVVGLAGYKKFVAPN